MFFHLDIKKFKYGGVIVDRRNKNKFIINGQRFVIASQSNTSLYLKCAQFRYQCRARAVMKKSTNVIYVTTQEHNHTSDSDDDYSYSNYIPKNESFQVKQIHYKKEQK